MMDDERDLTLRQLQGLAVLQPDAARRERVLRRCHAVLDRQPSPDRRSRGWRFDPDALEAALTCALSAGLVAALIQDFLRVYWRR